MAARHAIPRPSPPKHNNEDLRMTIASIMNPRIATTGPDEGFIDLLKTMRSKPSRLLHVVAKDGKLLGVISNYDLLKVMLPFYMDSNLAKAVAFDEEFARRTLQENKGLTAKDIMVADCVTLTEDAHFLEAEALLKEKGVNALSVVDAAGRAVGEETRKAGLSKLIDLLAPDTKSE